MERQRIAGWRMTPGFCGRIRIIGVLKCDLPAGPGHPVACLHRVAVNLGEDSWNS